MAEISQGEQPTKLSPEELEKELERQRLESEWLNPLANSRELIQLLETNNKSNDRKLRLFAVACSRQAYELDPRKRSQQSTRQIETAELFADGNASVEELNTQFYYHGLTIAYQLTNPIIGVGAREAGGSAAGIMARFNNKDGYKLLEEFDQELVKQSVLMREVFGNPFAKKGEKPKIEPDWLTWNSGAVPLLAQAIYDEKEFGKMPVLWDALEEAGCTNEEILKHCRQKEHVRGCWVIDLILGR
ncbi:MAG: hypothetical protein A3D34_01700 [Candidatus Staskawiczbacteria bacterium RIFCSPHIGHO2_02_FULL_33_16]|uniref:Uncharacterized protein n=1 Tax=Candidatus Staskawiczbacteria bacterium RIFCSPHIGHO2_02_FULL_33_16 TaxID=1802204 RepID=A0A1G2HTX1_9BACT|nr:MAG: hypothetical protein A3D34_01700 [Candidatus Staskawiczbacteria bacterium RIFCSPHIGHO2_02_FULL_33_16]OGZ70539.1 MAG: hypothetical protein A2980_01150 [Candidatus Staskawiczbacteria bacterium RIFCSPLOWO2_01_FULL_33_13]